MPRCAISNLPGLRATAPVKAPFSWPKSSVSSSVSGIAAQLIATNGASARGLSACSERANSSLPVPLSPSSSTVVSVAAARCSDGEHLAQRRVLADQLRRAAAHRELLLHQQVLGHHAALLERAAHEQQQVIGIDRLGEEVERPFLHRRHRVLDAAVGGHHDDRHVGVDFLRRAQDAEAVSFRAAADRRAPAQAGLLQQPDRFGLIARLEHGVPLPLQRVPQHRAQRVLVFDDAESGRELPRGRGSAQPAGRNTGLARFLFDVCDLLLCCAMSALTRSSSASAFWRSSPILPR